MKKHDTYLAALASGKKALSRRHTHQKLVPETDHQSSGTRNLHVCQSIWYQISLVPVSVME